MHHWKTVKLNTQNICSTASESVIVNNIAIVNLSDGYVGIIYMGRQKKFQSILILKIKWLYKLLFSYFPSHLYNLSYIVLSFSYAQFCLDQIMNGHKHGANVLCQFI